MAETSKIEWTDGTVRDPLVLAYLAGMIDGDGYITITRSVRAGVPYHGASVGIAGTRREPHDLAASLWGGKVTCYVPSANPRHRPQFQWSRQGRVAAVAIANVLPYLRVKAANALLALELQEHVDLGRSDDPFPWFGPDYDARGARDAMRAEMMETLNVRSPHRVLDGVTHDGYPEAA